MLNTNDLNACLLHEQVGAKPLFFMPMECYTAIFLGWLLPDCDVHSTRNIRE